MLSANIEANRPGGCGVLLLLRRAPPRRSAYLAAELRSRWLSGGLRGAVLLAAIQALRARRRPEAPATRILRRSVVAAEMRRPTTLRATKR